MHFIATFHSEYHALNNSTGRRPENRVIPIESPTLMAAKQKATRELKGLGKGSITLVDSLGNKYFKVNGVWG